MTTTLKNKSLNGFLNIKNKNIIYKTKKLIEVLRQNTNAYLENDIAIISKNSFVIFISFLASLYLQKKLFIIKEKTQIKTLILERKIGSIIFTNTIDYGINSFFIERLIVTKLLENVIEIDTNLFINTNNFETHNPIKQYKHKEINLIEKTLFPNDFMHFLKTVMFYSHDKKVLSILKKTTSYNYSLNNIKAALEALDSEFSDSSFKIVDFSKTIFDNSFVYILYFLFDNKELVFKKNTPIFEKNKKKKLIIVDEEFIKPINETQLKIKYYKKINIFFRDLIGKLYIYISNTTLLKNTFNITSKDELLILNSQSIFLFNDIVKKSFIKTSYIFATPQTCNVLSINRCNDKEIKKKDQTYRIINRDPSFKYHTNKLQELLISGDIVINDYKTEMSKKIQKKELYYNTQVYFNVDNDIITLLANKEDIYYDDSFNPINIGFIKKSLSILPFVKNIIVGLTKNEYGIYTIIPIISLNNKVIKQTFAFNNYHSIQEYLKKYLNVVCKEHDCEINKDIAIVKDNFFVRIRNFYENDYYFIRSVANSKAS